MENTIKVYIKLDSNNVITDVLSNIESVITGINIENWTQIDEGTGDKYSHAQGNYFPKEKGLRDDNGKYNYKLVDSKVIVLTDEEKETLFPTLTPSLTLEERVAMIENLQLQQEGVI